MAIDSSAVLHPTAIVEDGAVIGPGCRIGPFCVVGPDVVLANEVTLHSHVALAGATSVGEGTTIWPFASIGHAPQDLKYRGEHTELIIGCRNRIREYATMSPGTRGGGGVTRVGDDNLFMMSIHIGHDCLIGNGIIMANNATLGGHCIVEDNVVLGGLCAIHQFVRIGRGAMIGGLAPVVADVIPYGSIVGERAHLAGLNLVGLKRRHAERGDINGLRAAFDEIFSGAGTLQERMEDVQSRQPKNPLIAEVARFIASGSTRAFTLPQR